jgi:hypothetical protein
MVFLIQNRRNIMSRSQFTDEQMKLLRQNPNTHSVTRTRLSFTKNFKEIFHSEYQAGEFPRQILIDHGYDPELLGDHRIGGIASRIQEQYKKHGEFHEGNASHRLVKPNTSASNKPTSEIDELKQLKHEVNYLKQEVEFLKKISSIRTTKK